SLVNRYPSIPSGMATPCTCSSGSPMTYARPPWYAKSRPSSAVDPVHLSFGVVAADGWGESIEPGQLLGCEFDGIRTDVLLEPRDALGSRNGDDVGTLRQQPRQCDLGRCGADVVADLPQLVGAA